MKKIILPLAALSLVACNSETPDETPADAGVSADAAPEDAGPPAARYLVEPKGLFGDTRVDNRFLNPNFDLNAEGWLAYPTQSGASRLPTVQRRFETDTPTRQPLLLLPKQGNDYGVGVVGTARAGAGAFDVSVWVGRPADAGDVPTTVSLIGTDYTEGERAWDLAAEAGSETVRGERRWVKWTLRLTTGPVGFANLVVYDDSETPIFLTGPQMVPATLEARLGAPRAAAPVSRSLRRVEVLARDALHRRFLGDLGRRPRDVRLPATTPRRSSH